jgi:hypothetical protein
LAELLVAGFGLYTLLLAQLMLSAAIHDTNYMGNDGKLYQSIVTTAFNFGGKFNVTNFNPLQGLGTQLIPQCTCCLPHRCGGIRWCSCG